MPDSAPVHITTRSGSVRVEAVAGTELDVRGGNIELQGDGAIHIRRDPSSNLIDVRCAPGTDITIGTVSGKVETIGSLGAVRVSTISGTIRVDEAARLDVRTKSGKIDIGTCAGDCRIMAKSSAVHVGSAGLATVAGISGIVRLERVRGAEVKTVSGKVRVGSTGGERVSVRTVSGKVEVSVPATTKPSTSLRSLSGKIRCDCAPGDDLEIAVVSVSGAIRVSCD